MKVEVDISEAIEIREASDTEFRKLRAAMLAAARKAAETERRTHPYTNRTGNLQRSTKASVDERAPDEHRIALDMGMHYASYVNARGYSHIDRVARGADADIREAIDDMSVALGRR